MLVIGDKIVNLDHVQRIRLDDPPDLVTICYADGSFDRFAGAEAEGVRRWARRRFDPGYGGADDVAYGPDWDALTKTSGAASSAGLPAP